MWCCVYGRLYYLDPGDPLPGSGTRCWCPPTTAPRWPSACGRRSGSTTSADSAAALGLAGADDLRRDETDPAAQGRGQGRAEAADPRARAADEGGRGRPRARPGTAAHHDLLHRAAPGRLPGAGPRPGATLHCRVELRQLGARDSARVQGGIGSCGRDLCCATFLTDFEPVTIRMAKDQDLPLNPLRISGACGRLMCCLKYEHPLYQEFKVNPQRLATKLRSPPRRRHGVGAHLSY